MEYKMSELPPALALAFLGDAVHSAYIREMLVKSGITKPGSLTERSLLYVTAAKQAEAFRRMEPILTEDERDVARRASNSKHLSRPHHAKLADYRLATGLETILGMHRFCGNEARIRELMALATADEDFKGISATDAE